MATAIENYKEAQHQLSALEKTAETIRAQISSALEVSAQFQKAQADLDNAKSARKNLLGMVYLGKGKVDTTQADKAVYQAAQCVEAMADARIGAEAASEVLQGNLESTEAEIWRLTQTLPALRYQAASDEADALIDDYMKSADETERKFASVAGSLMVIQSLQVSDAPPFAWHHKFNLEILLPDLPFLNKNGYQGLRSHMRLLPKAQDQKAIFAARLEKLGIV